MIRLSAAVRLRSIVLQATMVTLMMAGVFPVVTASAQTSTGGLRGFVKDGTGGVLAGVTVEASSPSRIGAPAVEVTDGQGLYSLPEPAARRVHAGLYAAGLPPCGARTSASRSAAPSRSTSASKSAPSSRP